MRTKQILSDLKKALQQDYLYNPAELKFMREQLLVLEEEVQKDRKRKPKPKGFGK